VAETLRYLASPYTAYRGGMEQAFIDVAILAGRLFAIGIPTFSPIAHAFPYVKYGNLDPLDYPAWKPVQERLMDACDSLIVAHMDGWEKSVGIAHEVGYFERSGKDIFDLDVETLVLIKRDANKHFDERMHLTLEDMKPFSGGRRELPPLAMPDVKGQ
jgi:Domain of unknown function (DUF1937)